MKRSSRDWLGVDHDSLPDRMAFLRAAPPRPLWLPPSIVTPRPSSVERMPLQPVPTTQEPVGQKATVTFGNLADIGKALRAARKARREELDQQAESFQSPLFDL